jgi:hypothetical protein
MREAKTSPPHGKKKHISWADEMWIMSHSSSSAIFRPISCKLDFGIKKCSNWRRIREKRPNPRDWSRE